MARLLPRLLLQIDVTCDKYSNTHRRLVTGGRNGGYGHTSLAASFVVVLVDCCAHSELVAFLRRRRHKHEIIAPNPTARMLSNLHF